MENVKILQKTARTAILMLILILYLPVLHGQGKKIVYPMRPKEEIKLGDDQLYYDLSNGARDVDWTRLDGTLKYIRSEYDCSDFRLVNLVRIIYEYGDLIPADYMDKIENTLLNFRYWWDEPGGNSMCYWSENHQILFAAAEYLVGQKYPDTVFPNSGLTGREHMEKARQRALDWFKMRWEYGYIEYYSSVYYKEDIGGLINLVDFAGDEELVMKAMISLDLLFFDVASQSIKNMFSSVSGRAYQNNRIGGNASGFDDITNYYWGDGKPYGKGITYGLLTTKKYSPPPVLAEIAHDTSILEIRQENGLELKELKKEGYYGTDNRSMMMQWAMEAFTNPIIIRNSIKHIRKYDMFTNDFVSDFRSMNFFLLRWLHLEPFLAVVLNPQYNGVAIQKGNTYTYKTPDYSLYTSQAHHPGEFADQQHIFGMNIGNNFSIFHNHPAREKDVKAQSPNYWVGYGHFPHSVQEKNVNLSIYNLPRRKGIMEKEMLHYTRAYFPVALFDTAFAAENYAFGKKGDTYCALIGTNPFSFRDELNDDLLQEGRKVYWITEAGSKREDGSFEAFVERIRNNPVDFNPHKLTLGYTSGGTDYQVKFGGDFLVDGNEVDTQYVRYNNPYIKAERKEKTLTFTCNGKKLFLDFDHLERVF